jgi:hypothetical protein
MQLDAAAKAQPAHMMRPRRDPDLAAARKERGVNPRLDFRRGVPARSDFPCANRNGDGERRRQTQGCPHAAPI